MNLRDGIKVDGQDLTREGLDELSKMTEPEAEASGAVAIFEAVKGRAEAVVAAGLETKLDLADLSLFEVLALAAARSEARKKERDLTAATIALAMRMNTAALVPDTAETSEAKFMFDFERRAWDLIGG